MAAAQHLLQDLRKEFQAEVPKEAAKEPEKEPAKDAPKEASKEAAKGPPPAGPSMPPPPMPPVRPPELARPDSAPPSSPPEAPPQDAQPAEAPPAGPALADIPLPAMAEAPADEVPPPLAPDLLMDMARLGKANGFDAVAEERAKLTPNEIAAFRASVQKCWKRPDNVPANAKLTIVLQVSLKPNGSLAGVPDPIAIEGAAAKFGPAFMRAAQTALRSAAPPMPRCRPANIRSGACSTCASPRPASSEAERQCSSPARQNPGRKNPDDEAPPDIAHRHPAAEDYARRIRIQGGCCGRRRRMSVCVRQSRRGYPETV